MPNSLPPSVLENLSTARQAIQKGECQRAHRLLREVTRSAPQQTDAWLLRASVAPSLREKFDCLSVVLQLEPDHPGAQRELYGLLQRQLARDPYIGYIKESDFLYKVHTRSAIPLVVPKNRAAPEPFSPDGVWQLRTPLRWLGLAFLGLLPAGIGSFLFAPPAFFSAVRINRKALNPKDKARVTLILWWAAILWLIGGLILALLILHF